MDAVCSQQFVGYPPLEEKSTLVEFNAHPIVERIKLLEDEKKQSKQILKELQTQRVSKNEYLDMISESRDFV